MKTKHDDLELTSDMLTRIDEIDNTVHQCICVLAEKEIDWNMEIIGEVADSIQNVLQRHGIKMRWPSIVDKADGTQHYSED